MTSAYVGQIALFAGSFPPVNWKFCDGSLLNIQSYQALYALIGTIYGGDGVTTFGLPNLRGRIAVGKSNTPPPGMVGTYPLASAGGISDVTLSLAQYPYHDHNLSVTTATATANTPSVALMPAALPTGFQAYVTPNAGAALTVVNLNANAVTSSAGGGQSHTNLMPTMNLNYIICAVGLFPDFN